MELNLSLDKEINSVMMQLGVADKTDNEICDALIHTGQLDISHEEEVMTETINTDTVKNEASAINKVDIKTEHEWSKESDNLSTEVKQQVPKNVKVITVQPIGYYDDLFPKSDSLDQCTSDTKKSRY